MAEVSSAKQALRRLHAYFIKKLDPSIVHDLYSAELITEGEKQKIDAGRTDREKNDAIMTALRRKDERAVLRALVSSLEGEGGIDKAANADLLKKISAEYPIYNFETGSFTEPANGGLAHSDKAGVADSVTQHQSGNRTSLQLSAIAEVSRITSHEGFDGAGESYKMDTKPRGYCIIINNMHFQTMKDRPGSQWDSQELQKVFGKHLGFQAEVFNDLEASEILQLMSNLQQTDHSKLSCLVVAILSHGENGEVYGADGNLVPVKRITDMFTGPNCPSLLGKPKVFILQACRGKKFDYGTGRVAVDGIDGAEDDDDDEVLGQEETDGGGYNGSLPGDADFILAYATTPGYVSWRNSAFGTWFIKSLTEVLTKKAKHEDFLSMLTEVNRKVAEEYESREHKNKQMPAPVTMLRYKLFFPPC